MDDSEEWPAPVEIGLDAPLCQPCTQFRDIDFLLTRVSNYFDHHQSCTAMRDSAEQGCPLCQLWILDGAVQELLHLERLQTQFPHLVDVVKTKEQNKIKGGIGSRGFNLVQAFDGTVRSVSSYNVSVDSDWVASEEANAPFQRRPISARADSDECRRLAARWLHECQTSHQECKAFDTVLPTRVIDVGSITGPTHPYLKTTAGAMGSWVALSHCWGGKQPLTTTLSTLEQRQQGISTADLPPLFQDAITITRDLGFRYLWIDSLCIVQDCPEDWARESAKMHQIYSEAALCIAASASKSSRVGILSPHNDRRQSSRRLAQMSCYSKSENATNSYVLSPNISDKLDSEPLHKRAWVLQESILSPRTLDFSSKQLHWNCRQATLSEETPYKSTVEYPLSSYAREFFEIPNEKLQLCPGAGRDTPMFLWYHVLHLFINREITKQADSLPAIAGIASKFHEKTGYGYKCGLWLEDIHRGLLWLPLRWATRSKDTRVPSWSWASINQPCYFDDLGYLTQYCEGFRAEVLDVTVNTVDDNPYGQVLSASLVLKGGCRSLDHWDHLLVSTFDKTKSSSGDLDFWKLGYAQFKPNSATPILFMLDGEAGLLTCHADLVQRGAICIQIAKFISGMYHKEIIFCLMLEPTGRREDEYQRIGIILIRSDNVAESWDVKTLTIV